MLPCGHSIYDIYTMIFGDISLLVEDKYLIPRCTLYRATKPLTVRIKLAIYAARVLSIDRGGPRGVIPLRNLKIL
jgi:hypothetical protein